MKKEIELMLRNICLEYHKNSELIDDALNESIDPGCRKAILEDISLRRGYASSPLNKYMSEVTYKREKFRAKLSLIRRINFAINGG